MLSLFKKTAVFVCSYLLLMIPTYILPYFGSNSALVYAVGGLFGHGMTPQWWMHAWSLVMLMLIANLRGKLIAKRYLVVFPLLAAAFDLIPGMSLVPLVPTVMHLMALVLGVMGTVVQESVPMVNGETDALPAALPAAIPPVGPSLTGEAWVASLMTVALIAGSMQFTMHARQALGSVPATPTHPGVKAPAASTSAMPAMPASETGGASDVAAQPANTSVNTSVKSTAKIAVHKTPASVKATTAQAPKSNAAPTTVRYININD